MPANLPTPTSRNNVPAINTNIAHDFDISAAPSTSPSSPLEPLRIPRTDISPTSPTARTQSTVHKVDPTNRARTESRKLLAHVLDQLHRRTLPPGIFDAFNYSEVQRPENNLGLLLRSVKGVVSPKKLRQDDKHQAPTGVGEDDSDEEGERKFSTDATYDLMLQLKDLLRVSMDRNWHILDDNPTDHQNDEYHKSNEKSGISPFRRARNSLQPGIQRSRSLSPSNSDRRRMRTPDLLSSCVSILASVVLEDCRYQIAFPRPSCPPNALQALTLDVAQFLLHTHCHDPIVISKIGFAMIPAFSTFRREMHGRLLTFFETTVIRGVLEDLEQIQGIRDLVPSANYFEKSLTSAASSVVAIHIDEVQEVPHRDPGLPRWKPWSLSQDSALKLQSTYAASQSLTLYSLSSLVSPLFATILEFVDFKPDARMDVLHRFSRLLRLIVETKLDAYSDLLQVVGYHTHKARRAALALLCTLWPKAVGHIGISRPFEDFYTAEDTRSFSLRDPNEHQFVPWRFPTLSSQSSSPELSGFSPQWDKFHHSCIEFYRDILRLSYSDLEMLNYEEISVIHSTLWIQAQIITSGIALGSIVVTRNGTTSNSARKQTTEDFELHHFIKWCEDLLASNKQQCSNAMDDYIEGNSLTPSEHFMMFDWTTLMYIRSILRSPYIEHQIPRGSSSDLLSVSHPGASIISSFETSSSFEVVPLSHMRNSLGHVLNIYSDVIARLLLSYLHHLGLFERTDRESLLFNGDDVTKVYCSFPLPFSLDLSPTVEVLVAAVEGCLQDLDLSVTEAGFLLLVKRLWPNGLVSDYALQRLTRCILSWVLAEDDHLATILRDYLAKGRPLPGVRTPQDSVLWPSSDRSRPLPSNLNNNGGDYLATRRALLSRYAKPWLLALHDLNPVAYASFVYDACLDVDFASNPVDYVKVEFATSKFKSFHSLPRVFPREGDGTNTNSHSEQADLPVDPWQVITRMAEEGSQGLGRSLQWLCLFAHSGVDIPLTIFETFSVLVMRFDTLSLTNSLLLAKAVMVSTWLKPKGRQEIQSLISQLHERLDLQITSALKSKEPDEDL
ncbi:hypothetical protein C0995_005048 [Termitomyces sp. Mi166|nr:hypothetical protein C0995_005048 [Termitomyces sp. Mi166\